MAKHQRDKTDREPAPRGKGGASGGAAMPTESLSIRFGIGRAIRFRTTVRLTPEGIAAIGGLVSMTLLSTAALVGVAIRESRRTPLPGRADAETDLKRLR